MKTASFYSLVALTQAPIVLAQGLRQATGGVGDASYTHQWYPVPTEEVSECEAKLITTLCDYKEPLSGTAVAAKGPKGCWEYCNKNQPCNFVIFVAGNPYTGTGTCWLYPGEEFKPSEGKEGCDYMSVFDKPVCAGDATPTSGACEATSSPSAVAEVCDYPTPDEKCWYGCTASSGAVDCLSQCVEADSCNFAVFNPHNEMESQYYSGSCWMYPEGKFDKSKAKTCKGKPEQYVYENPCPKPKPSTTSSSSSAARTSSNGDDGDSSSSSKSSKSDDEDAEGAEQNKATDGDNKNSEDGDDDDNGSMMVGVSLSGAMAAGLAVLLWQGVQ